MTDQYYPIHSYNKSCNIPGWGPVAIPSKESWWLLTQWCRWSIVFLCLKKNPLIRMFSLPWPLSDAFVIRRNFSKILLQRSKFIAMKNVLGKAKKFVANELVLRSILYNAILIWYDIVSLNAKSHWEVRVFTYTGISYMPYLTRKLVQNFHNLDDKLPLCISRTSDLLYWI